MQSPWVPNASELFEAKSPQVNKIQVDDAWHFQHDGREFLSFKTSAHELSVAYRASFRQFLAHRCNIHPEIRRQLVEFGKLPETLTFMSREGTVQTKVRYSLRNASFTEKSDIFEIPQGFAPSDGDSPLHQILKSLAQTEIPGHAELQKESEGAIDNALLNGSKFEALLAAQRYFLITDDGIGYGRLLQRCGGIDDTEIQRILYEFGNIRKMQEAKRTLDASKSRLSYLLNYHIADMAMSVHRQDIEARTLLLDALSADVLIVGAYLDLSRLFMADWDISSAWQCIDAAKKIAPSHSDLGPIKSMEKGLEVDFPDYF